MSEVFSADVSKVKLFADLMREIEAITGDAVGRFEDGARTCLDWVGRDDEMFEQLSPRDRKEREDTTKTGTSLMEAIAGISRALKVNGDIIQGAQNDVHEAIDDASRKSGRH
ncbi:hypothetical protein [Streptomyces sp. NPDC002463]|uniref:hypothetical protein n=1 Tax=Streptomyces sp. NPDC002463 TaxID=3364645 RepID=UPI003685C1FC